MVLFTLGTLLGFALALLVPPLLGIAKDVVNILEAGALGNGAEPR